MGEKHLTRGVRSDHKVLTVVVSGNHIDFDATRLIDFGRHLKKSVCEQ
jgi:hypothetical protein